VSGYLDGRSVEISITRLVSYLYVPWATRPGRGTHDSLVVADAGLTPPSTESAKSEQPALLRLHHRPLADLPLLIRVLLAQEAATYARNVSAAGLAPLAVLVAILAIDSWVYCDAKSRLERGRPVNFRAGSFVIDSPAMWFVGCLILFVVCFPLYVASRR